MRKSKTKKHGTVSKVIKSPIPQMPEKAEIAVKDADPLYREIRVENTLENEDGKQVKLREGAHVDITIEAEPEGTVEKSDSDSSELTVSRAKARPFSRPD